MSTTRRSYSPGQKVKIIKEHLLNRRDISEICREYDIHPNMFYRWQRQFFENGEKAFQKQKDTRAKVLETKVSKLEDKLQEE